MLRDTVSENRYVSWNTIDVCVRSDDSVTSRMSAPSIVIRPRCGS
jgi:hypothetical protein